MDFLIDIALAGVSALFAWRLSRKARFNGHVSVWLWASAFVALGSGAMLGMFHRQIGTLLGGTPADMLLRLSLAVLLLANTLLLAGVIMAYCAGKVRWTGLGLVGAKLFIFLMYLGVKPSFDIVVYDAAFTALPMLALCTYGAWTWKYPYAQWIVAGAVIWVFAAMLHQGRVGASQFFTADDLFRAFEIGVLFLFVRGGWNMRDEPTSSTRLNFKTISWRL